VVEPGLASSGEAWEVEAPVAREAAGREVLEREEVPAEQEEAAVEESLLVVAQEWAPFP
jgi:hypothetical protein